MSRPTALTVTAIGLAFVALGVLILAQGDAEGRPLGIACIAFFGGCALAGLVELFPIRRRAKLNREGALVVRRLEPIGLSLAGIAMGAGCFFLTPYTAAQGDVMMKYVAYFGAAFFGGGSLCALGWTLVRPPLARIYASGVEMFGAFGWKLAWREIIAIQAQSFGHDQGFLDFVTAYERPAANEHDVQEKNLDDEDRDELEQESSNRRTLSLAGTGLALEDVSKIVDELWQRHRGD